MYDKQSIIKLFIEQVTHRYNKKFSIKTHDQSKFLRFFKPIIKVINPDFYNSISIYLFNTLWVSEKFFEKELMEILSILSHETVHVYDKTRFGSLFFYSYYLFPQILSLFFFAISFLVSFWFLIPAIICLAPLPSYMRYRLELRAYLSSQIFNKFVYKVDDDMMNEFIAHVLSTRVYYFCWPFKKAILRTLKKGTDFKAAPYSEIIIFLKRYGFMKL